MLREIIYLFCCLFLLNFTHALDLDWRSIPIESIDYNRKGIKGGAALYTLPNSSSLKFRIQFVFPDGVFSNAKKDITTLNALSDLLILGGFGKKNYAEIEKILTQNAISLSTSLNELGQLTITCEALKEDFSRSINLLEELILTPIFDSKALELWKQQARNSYKSFTNANTLAIQMQFIGAEASKLAFGSQHYLATAIQRSSPKYTNAVKLTDIKNIYKKIRNRNGLIVMLSGAYPAKSEFKVKRLISKVSSDEIPTLKWVPRRLKKTASKVKLAIIRKPDMTQSQISLRYYYPGIGELNPLEKSQMSILSEIYSSTGGVVGNDRFSKAMRADSGISYSPRARFISDVIAPNTNVSAFIMSFQSPNERIVEAVKIAKNTWNTFLKKGVTAPELMKTRRAVMNSMLANELTVFDKSNYIFSKILNQRVPSVNPIQQTLESLDAQKNTHDINRFLKNSLASPSVGVLVIMGNPSKSQIIQLKSISDLDFIELTDINSLK